MTIRFAGDSGDGMQLAGTQFTKTVGRLRQRHQHLPRHPRRDPRPAGLAAGRQRLPGQLLEHDIYTPGDAPDVLVAMNPAALKTNIGDLPRGGILIVNEDEFTEPNLKKAAYATNPLEDGRLSVYRSSRCRSRR